MLGGDWQLGSVFSGDIRQYPASEGLTATSRRNQAHPVQAGIWVWWWSSFSRCPHCSSLISFQIGPNGYYFAIDPNGYVLLHPNLQPKVPKHFLYTNTSNMTSQHIYDPGRGFETVCGGKPWHSSLICLFLVWHWCYLTSVVLVSLSLFINIPLPFCLCICDAYLCSFSPTCVCDFEWHEHMSVCSCMHLYQAYVQYYGGPNLSYESAIEVPNWWTDALNIVPLSIDGVLDLAWMNRL